MLDDIVGVYILQCEGRSIRSDNAKGEVAKERGDVRSNVPELLERRLHQRNRDVTTIYLRLTRSLFCMYADVGSYCAAGNCGWRKNSSMGTANGLRLLARAHNMYRDCVDERSPGPAGCQLSYGDEGDEVCEGAATGGPCEGEKAGGRAKANLNSTDSAMIACILKVDDVSVFNGCRPQASEVTQAGGSGCTQPFASDLSFSAVQRSTPYLCH